MKKILLMLAILVSALTTSSQAENTYYACPKLSGQILPEFTIYTNQVFLPYNETKGYANVTFTCGQVCRRIIPPRLMCPKLNSVGELSGTQFTCKANQSGNIMSCQSASVGYVSYQTPQSIASVVCDICRRSKMAFGPIPQPIARPRPGQPIIIQPGQPIQPPLPVQQPAQETTTTTTTTTTTN